MTMMLDSAARKLALPRRVPVQLKRLPPERMNATETLESILKKTAGKCTGDDLLVAIHVDRSGHLTSTSVPKRFRVRELCLWGWSKPNNAEIFVNSYEIGAPARANGPFPFLRLDLDRYNP